MERIENPTSYMYLQLLKDPKHHDRNELADVGVKIAVKFVRAFYKIVYFYIYPILLIPLCPLLYYYYGAKNNNEDVATFTPYPVDFETMWAETFDFTEEIYLYFYVMVLISARIA